MLELMPLETLSNYIKENPESNESKKIKGVVESFSKKLEEMNVHVVVRDKGIEAYGIHIKEEQLNKYIKDVESRQYSKIEENEKTNFYKIIQLGNGNYAELNISYFTDEYIIYLDASYTGMEKIEASEKELKLLVTDLINKEIQIIEKYKVIRKEETTR